MAGIDPAGSAGPWLQAPFKRRFSHGGATHPHHDPLTHDDPEGVANFSYLDANAICNPGAIPAAAGYATPLPATYVYAHTSALPVWDSHAESKTNDGPDQHN